MGCIIPTLFFTMNELIKKIIDDVRNNSFKEEYKNKATDEECLGIAISKHFKWDGEAIFKTATSAFEDSNFHGFNEKFETIWNEGN